MHKGHLGGSGCSHTPGPFCESTWGFEASFRDRGTNWILVSVSAVTAFGICSVNLPFPHCSFPAVRQVASANHACSVALLQDSREAPRAADSSSHPFFALLSFQIPFPQPPFLSHAREKPVPTPLTWQMEVWPPRNGVLLSSGLSWRPPWEWKADDASLKSPSL